MKTQLLFLAVLAFAAGCGGDVQQPPASERTGSAGVTVEILDGWHTTTWDDGHVVDPLTRVVVASAPIARKETACQVAAYEFDADAVALVVLEWEEPLRTLQQRPARFTSRELPVQPPPAVECFDGSGGAVSFIDHGRAFGAYLLAGPRAPAPLVDEARGVLDTLRVERRKDVPLERLARNGISVAVPAGWDGRILFREATGRDGVLFQVANFALPDNEGLEPPTKLPPGQEDPIKAMDGDDVLVMISEPASWDATPSAESGAVARKPPTLAELMPIRGPRVPHGESRFEGSHCVGSRCLGVLIAFGAAEPDEDLVRRVNEVLASLAVGG